MKRKEEQKKKKKNGNLQVQSCIHHAPSWLPSPSPSPPQSNSKSRSNNHNHQAGDLGADLPWVYLVCPVATALGRFAPLHHIYPSLRTLVGSIPLALPTYLPVGLLLRRYSLIVLRRYGVQASWSAHHPLSVVFPSPLDASSACLGIKGALTARKAHPHGYTEYGVHPSEPLKLMMMEDGWTHRGSNSTKTHFYIVSGGKFHTSSP